jgi:hypothetical protein
VWVATGVWQMQMSGLGAVRDHRYPKNPARELGRLGSRGRWGERRHPGAKSELVERLREPGVVGKRKKTAGLLAGLAQRIDRGQRVEEVYMWMSEFVVESSLAGVRGLA